MTARRASRSRRRRLVVALSAAILASAAVAPFTQATKYFDSFFPNPIPPVGQGGAFSSPRDIAVNESANQVYVVDQGNNRIQRFSTAGAFQRAWGGDVVVGGATGTGTVTNGSTSVTAVVTTSKAFVVGQTITGTGIAAGTRITAVGSGTITLSQAATPAAAGALTPLSVATGAGNVSTNEQQTVTVTATGGNFRLAYTTPNPSPTTAAANTTVNIPFNAPAADVQTALEALGNIGAGNVAVSSPNPTGGPYTVTFQGTRFADTNVAQMTVVAGSPSPLTGGTATPTTLREGASAFEICTAVTDCKVGLASGGNAADNLMNGAMSSPQGVELDPTTSDVFVRDRLNNRVNEYTGDGAFVRSWGFDVAQPATSPATSAVFETCFPGDICRAGAPGSGLGQFGTTSASGDALLSTGIAVAPLGAPHPRDVYVVDPGAPTAGGLANRRVLRFGVPANPASAVTAEEAIGTAAVFGAVGGSGGDHPRHLAIDGDGILYASANGASAAEGIARYDTGETPAAPLSRIEGGNSSSTLGVNVGGVNGLEVDTDNGRLWVATDAPGGILEFDVATSPADIDSSDLVERHAAGLNIGQNQRSGATGVGFNSASGEIYLSTVGVGAAGTGGGSAPGSCPANACHRVLVLDDDGVDPPPTVDLIPPTDIGSTTATLSAEINPNGPTGFPTSYRFQVSKDGINWIDVAPDQLVGATGDGGSPVLIDDSVTGLEPNTLYRLRVRTQRNPDAGVALSSELVFSTDPAPPIVETAPARSVTDTGAELAGRLNPGGLQTSYWFEWGDNDYGNRAPVPDGQLSGGILKPVVTTIDGLSPESVYHFRLCAQNSLSPAKVCGADAVFTTNASIAAPGARAYEMVTSPDKVLRRGGGHGVVDSDTDYMRFAAGLPSTDGNSLLWGIYAGASDPNAGNGYSYDYGFEIRRRQDRDGDGKADGWYGEATVNVPPPVGGNQATNVLDAVSADLNTQTWALRVPMFASGAQAATRVMGDDGGPRNAGWYPWLDPAWFGGNLATDFDLSAYIDDQGERMVGWNNAPGNQHLSVTGVEDALPPSGLTPAQTSGTPLFLADPAHDWAPTDLINECTGAGGDATLLPTRDDSGTEVGPPGGVAAFADFAASSAVLTAQTGGGFLPDFSAVQPGHYVTGPGIAPGARVVSVDSPTQVTISIPTTAPGSFSDVTFGPNVAAGADDTIATRECGEGSPTDVRGAALGAVTGNARLAGASTMAMSDTGDRVFFMSPDPLVAGAACDSTTGTGTACPPQLFVRQYDDAGDPTVRWISRAEDDLFDAPQNAGLFGNGAAFEGASRDGDSVYFRTNAPLTEDDPNGGPLGSRPVTAGSASPVSWDLYRYDLPSDNGDDPTGPEAGGLTRISGGPDQNADANTNCTSAAADCGGSANGGGAAMRFLSDDGERAYFVTAAPIGNPDPQVDSWNSRPEHGVTTPGGSATGNVATRNLYVYDGHESGDDAYKFVARIPFAAPGQGLDSCLSSNPSGGVSGRRAEENTGVNASLRPSGGSCVHGTSSGDALVFESGARLTSDDDDDASDVYLYDYKGGDRFTRLTPPPPEDGAYVCLTTNTGAPTVLCNGDLGIGTIATSGAQAGKSPGSPGTNVGQAGMRHHNIAENPDGSFKAVYFETRNGLVADDVNGDHMDVYEWRADGRLRLLSPGNSPNSAFFTGNSRDGRDVFFWTEQRISPWEIDPVDGDVYDARLDGGLPDPVTPPPVCAVLDDDCQALGGSVTSTSPTTDNPGGGNAPTPIRPKLALAMPSSAQRTLAARTGTLTVRVRSSTAGRLTIDGRARIGKRRSLVGRAAKRVGVPGVVDVRIRLNKQARRALANGKRINVVLTAKLSGARAQTATVPLRRAGR